MKNLNLKQTSVIIALLLVVAFILVILIQFLQFAPVFSDYQIALTDLSSEKTYQKISESFARPYGDARGIFNESQLQQYLVYERTIPTAQMAEDMQLALESYVQEYGLDVIYLVSCASEMGYSNSGQTFQFEQDLPRYRWYYDFLEGGEGATCFIGPDPDEPTQKILFMVSLRTNAKGVPLAVIATGLRTDTVRQMLKEYSAAHDLNASIIDESGIIQHSTIDSIVGEDFFEYAGMPEYREEALAGAHAGEVYTQVSGAVRISVRTIGETPLLLASETNASAFYREFFTTFLLIFIVVTLIVTAIIALVMKLIHNYDERIQTVHEASEQHLVAFRRATERLYTSILFFNLSKNCAADQETKDFFTCRGLSPDASVEDFMRRIAEKELNPEHRTDYLDAFAPRHVITEFEQDGITMRTCAFQLRAPGEESYQWFRTVAHVWKSEGDIYMLSYRQNIDKQMRQEETMRTLAERDGLTDLYNKVTTKALVDDMLTMPTCGSGCALFILDIDNFKSVNDTYGHAFGDVVLQRFAQVMRESFRQNDILGRIGGDEFCVFLRATDLEILQNKAATLSKRLDMTIEDGEFSCKTSASIGIYYSEDKDITFEQLYRSADAALYETKQKGRNGFTIRKA